MTITFYTDTCMSQDRIKRGREGHVPWAHVCKGLIVLHFYYFKELFSFVGAHNQVLVPEGLNPGLAYALSANGYNKLILVSWRFNEVLLNISKMGTQKQ